jgi:hypothetical protein
MFERGWFFRELIKWAIPIIGTAIISYFIGKADGQSQSPKEDKITTESPRGN